MDLEDLDGEVTHRALILFCCSNAVGGNLIRTATRPGGAFCLQERCSKSPAYGYGNFFGASAQ
jgi:hypothetical protein